MFQNVLLGIDGSPGAQQALGRAIDIARSSRGRIGLLGVVPAPSMWLALPPFALPVSRERLAEDLEAEARRHVEEADRAIPPDVSVTKLLAYGSASDALLTHALDGPWDLIVVGHSTSSDRRPLRRGVGARLVRASPVPVLVVRGAVQPRRAARASSPAPLRPAQAGRARWRSPQSVRCSPSVSRRHRSASWFQT